MFRLAHHIRREPDRIGGLIRRNQDFTGPCNHVDINRPIEQFFGGRDIDIPRPDDLVHPGDRLGAIGERSDRLCTAEQEYPVNPRNRRCGQDIWIGGAVFARRGHHDNLPDLRNLRRDAVHQHRRRVGRRTARHIQTDPFEPPDSLSHDHAACLGIYKTLLNLVAVEGGDVLHRLEQ